MHVKERRLTYIVHLTYMQEVPISNLSQATIHPEVFVFL